MRNLRKKKARRSGLIRLRELRGFKDEVLALSL
jgi:hypothetical protein